MDESVRAAVDHDIVDRRAAIKELLMTGMTASAAYSALGIMPAHAATDITTPQALAELDQNLLNLKNIVTNPDVITDILAVQSLGSDGERKAAAQQFIAKYSAPENLKKYNVDATGLRLSLRVFEVAPGAGGPSTTNLASADVTPIPAQVAAGANPMTVVPAITVCGSIGYIACVSVGALK